MKVLLQSWTKVLGHLHFFAENRPSSISPSPLPLSMLYQWAESALFRSNIDQGGGGRHFAQTRLSRASKTERLANTCHIFRLSQGLLSRIVEHFQHCMLLTECRGPGAAVPWPGRGPACYSSGDWNATDTRTRIEHLEQVSLFVPPKAMNNT